MNLKNKGFTIIELIIVVAVVGITASLLIGGDSDEVKYNNCMENSSFIREHTRSQYCLDKLVRDDARTDAFLSN